MLNPYEERDKCYKKVLDNDHGAEFLRWLARECQAYSPTYAPDNPTQTAYNEGKRQVYLHIVGILQQDPHLLSKMLQVDNEKRQLNALVNNIQGENYYG